MCLFQIWVDLIKLVSDKTSWSIKSMKSMHKLRPANSPFPLEQPDDDDDDNDDNDKDEDEDNDT